MMLILILLVRLVVSIFFVYSIFSRMRLVDKKNRRIPAWLSWLMLIPLLDFIVAWVVLPFGVPQSFKGQVLGNEIAEKKAQSLFVFGLILMIIVTVSILVSLLGIFLLIPGSNNLFGLLSISTVIFFFVYWKQLLGFEKRYFLCSKSKKNEINP